MRRVTGWRVTGLAGGSVRVRGGPVGDRDNGHTVITDAGQQFEKYTSIWWSVHAPASPPARHARHARNAQCSLYESGTTRSFDTRPAIVDRDL